MLKKAVIVPGKFLPLLFAFLASIPVFAQNNVTNDEAREKLAEILNRFEFVFANRGYSLSQKINELIAKILGGIFGPAAGINPFNYPLLFFLLALIILIVLFVAGRLRKSFTGDKSLILASGDEPFKPSPADLRHRADLAKGENNFREALRYLYLSLLMALNEKDFISFRLSKTNLDYISEIRSRKLDFLDNFRQAVALFERKWYGLEPCTAADFDNFQTLYMQLLREGSA